MALVDSPKRMHSSSVIYIDLVRTGKSLRHQCIVRYIPKFILRPLIRAALPSRFMEVGGVWHVSQAGDEMDQLAKELGEMVDKSALEVPALKRLLDRNF